MVVDDLTGTGKSMSAAVEAPTAHRMRCQRTSQYAKTMAAPHPQIISKTADIGLKDALGGGRTVARADGFGVGIGAKIRSVTTVKPATAEKTGAGKLALMVICEPSAIRSAKGNRNFSDAISQRRQRILALL
jgi:hypothetical protein